MSTIIGVMGESGSGKSTSLKNLDESKTFIIDSDRKGLPFKGWKTKYNKEKKNYLQTSDIQKIEQTLNVIDKNEEYKNIEIVVIDTLNACMIDLEMSRMHEKNYDKWSDLAQETYELLSKCLSMRQNLYVICLCHSEDIQDDNDNHFFRIATSGRKLQKIKLESKMIMVLFAKCQAGKYFFETQTNNSTAKSPQDLFSELQIENDLKKVIDTYKIYDNDFPFTESEIKCKKTDKKDKLELN